jgi:hypothetical protein
MANSVDDSVKHLIATYNMSFATDINLDPTIHTELDPVKYKELNPNVPLTFASEATFQLTAINLEDSTAQKDTRTLWKKALELVQHFWKEPNASVIGLQEINIGKGGKEIETEISKISTPEKTLKMVSGEAGKEPVFEGIATIWDSTKLGDIVGREYIADLNFTPTEILEKKKNKNGIETTAYLNFPGQTGRPIIIIYTTKGYLLINCHGPNYPLLSEKTMSDLKESINKYVNEFLFENKIDINNINPSKVFFMGDINDRYDAINNGIDIKIIDRNTSKLIKEFTLYYEGKAPLSCCHNWDSSCSDVRFKSKDLLNRKQIVGTCDVPKDTEGVQYTLAGPGLTKQGEYDKPIRTKLTGQRYPMNDEGYPKNYRYTGDKIFGKYPLNEQTLTIYRPDSFKDVNMSDHEMVIGTFESMDKDYGFDLIYPGGYLSKNKHNKSHKAQKSHKARKSKKSRKAQKSRKTKKSRAQSRI